jgi:hypothetical protein
MLTYASKSAVRLALHSTSYSSYNHSELLIPPYNPRPASSLTQSFPNGNNIALNNDRLAHRDRPQVGYIQRPAHADEFPEVRLRDGNQRCRGGDVEDGGGASAV